MLNDEHAGFLKARILEIGSALFANTGNATFRLPTSIITVLRVDDDGSIWFFLHNPDLFMEEGDKNFPARLDFYRKGKPFFVQVSGTAHVVTDPLEIRELTGDLTAPSRSFARVMLVKVEVEHASCFEQRAHRPSALQACWHAVCRYLFQEKPIFRPYKMYPMKLA